LTWVADSNAKEATEVKQRWGAKRVEVIGVVEGIENLDSRLQSPLAVVEVEGTRRPSETGVHSGPKRFNGQKAFSEKITLQASHMRHLRSFKSRWLSGDNITNKSDLHLFLLRRDTSLRPTTVSFRLR
jgi:hypothetical protein